MKKIFVFIMLGIAVLTTAGCGGGNATPEKTTVSGQVSEGTETTMPDLSIEALCRIRTDNIAKDIDKMTATLDGTDGMTPQVLVDYRAFVKTSIESMQPCNLDDSTQEFLDSLYSIQEILDSLS